MVWIQGLRGVVLSGATSADSEHAADGPSEELAVTGDDGGTSRGDGRQHPGRCWRGLGKDRVRVAERQHPSTRLQRFVSHGQHTTSVT